MLIYLADTIQREHLKYNIKFGIKNHLESYWALLKQKKNTIDKWEITKEK